MPASPNSAWEKSSSDLIALFTRIAPSPPFAVVKQMFGWPCCFANGNLFFGLHKQALLFRLSESDQRKLLEMDGTTEFEPMPGRKMTGYVVITDPLEWNEADLHHWMKAAHNFALTLPPKQAKPQRGGAAKSSSPKKK